MRTTLITHSGRLSNINHNWKISKPASYAIPLILFNILTNWYLSELYFCFFRPWLTLTAQWSVRKTRRILKKLTRVPSKSGGKEKGCAQVEDSTLFKEYWINGITLLFFNRGDGRDSGRLSQTQEGLHRRCRNRDGRGSWRQNARHLNGLLKVTTTTIFTIRQLNSNLTVITNFTEILVSFVYE